MARTTAAMTALALIALTGAAQAAQQSCTFSSSDAKIAYLFEVHSDGLEEIGSMTKNSVKISPPADRPRWKMVDHPGVSINFISPDGDGFSIDDHSTRAIAMIKGVPYAGGCRFVTGATEEALRAKMRAKLGKRCLTTGEDCIK